MRPEALRYLLNQRPFQPFRIHVSDGASYDVTHPEGAILLPTGVNIRLPPAGMLGGPGVYRAVLISFVHITRVEVFLFGEAQAS
jgi:hypothetical protein